MAGSATAATSATVRLAQPLSLCQDGLGSKAEQPEPAPSEEVDQTDSLQPRALFARFSAVPPTAVTYWDAAGYSTPNPESPEEAVIATPGWL